MATQNNRKTNPYKTVTGIIGVTIRYKIKQLLCFFFMHYQYGGAAIITHVFGLAWLKQAVNK